MFLWLGSTSGSVSASLCSGQISLLAVLGIAGVAFPGSRITSLFGGFLKIGVYFL